MKFKAYLTQETQVNEAFDQTPLVPLALKWLKQKFPFDTHGYVFKHNPKLLEPTKSYDISIENKEFVIAGRLFDTNSDGTKDTVVFRINPSEEEPESEAGF
jgi:hypothetical protein